MATILIGMTHVAGANYGMAIASLLNARGHTVFFAADGAAAKRLMDGGVPFESGGADKLVEHIRPDLVVACIAGVDDPGAIELRLAREAARRGIPWTGQEDTQGVVTRAIFSELFTSHAPTVLCLVDAYSAELFRETYPGFSDDRIRIVGNPTWDAVLTQRDSIDRASVRRALEISDEQKFVVYLAGKGITRVLESLSVLSGALGELFAGRRDQLVLAPFFHPGCQEWMRTVTPTNPLGVFLEHVPAGSRTLLRSIYERACGTNDLLPLLAAADVVVSTASSENERALLLGTPVIRPFFPGDRRFLEGARYRPPHYFSDVALGASLGVTTDIQFLVALDSLLFSGKGRASLIARMRHHYAAHDGYGAQVCDAIEEAIRK